MGSQGTVGRLRELGRVGRRTRWGFATVMVLIAAAVAAPASGGASTTSGFLTLLHTDIVAPSTELQLKPVVDFRVLTPRDVRSFSARLGGHDVTRSFHRIAADMYAGAVRWQGVVRPGATSLTVATTSRSGQRSADARPFLLATRSRRELTVGGLSRADYVPGGRIVITLRRPASVLNVRLNGHLVSSRFTAVRAPGRERLVGRLAADDGLHFGANRLTIAAGSAGGVGAYDARVLRVARRTALVSAGADRGTVAGQTVRLDAGATRAAVNGGRLAYRWRLVGRPAGSHAHIIDPTAARPRLRTDRAGDYEAQVTVTEPGATAGGATGTTGTTAMSPASDVASVSATPPAGPDGVPVSVGATGITMNGTLYPFGSANVIALVLDRATLAPMVAAPLDLGSDPIAASRTLSTFATPGDPDLIVIAAKPGTPIGQGWGIALSEVGDARVDTYVGRDTPPPIDRLENGGWSAVGVAGAESGGFLDVPTGGGYDTGAELSGHFEIAPGVEPLAYSYIDGDYTTFDTESASTATTDTMLVDGTSYTSDPLPAGCSGGLYMVILAARDLQETFGTTVPTNCADPAVAQQGLQTMDSELHNQAPEYPNQGRHLVFVQTIGTAPWSADPGVEQARYQVGLDLSGLHVHTGNGAPASLDFGASAGVFDNATSGYGLAGFDGFDESGSIATDGIEAAGSSANPTGAVSGVLRRDDQSDYEPILGSAAQPVSATTPGGVPAAAALPVIADQPPTGWPTDSMPDSANIIDYIATQVLSGPQSGIANSPFADPSTSDGACDDPPMPDVRSEYCNLGFVDSTNWSTAIADLVKVQDAPPAQFVADGDWTQIVDQLITEMNIVSSVFSYVTLTQATLTDSNTGLPTVLTSVVGQVDAALKVPPAPVSSGAPGFWTDFASDLASLAGAGQDIFEAGESKYINGIGALGFIIGDLLDAPNGQPELESSIPQSEVDDLASQVYTRYQMMIPALGEFGNLIVSDWGRLNAFSASQLGDFSTNDQSSLGVGMSLGAAQFAWTQLLPTVYNLDQTFNGAGPNPNTPPGADQFECYAGTEEPETYRPFGPGTMNGPASAADQDVVPIPSATVNGYPDTAQTYVLAGPGDPTTYAKSFNDNQLVHPTLPPASITNVLFDPPAGTVGNITALGLNQAEFYEQTFPTPRFINCFPP